MAIILGKFEALKLQIKDFNPEPRFLLKCDCGKLFTCPVSRYTTTLQCPRCAHPPHPKALASHD